MREREEEQQARNELFAGKDDNNDGAINIDPTQIPLEDQTVDQLVNTAVRTHKDTTAVAQRALKVVQESREVQASTMKKLESQNKTMYNINSKMDEVNAELTYAEKLLSYMRRCCCCWVCDSCTGADPEEQRKREWKRRVDRGETQLGAGPGAGIRDGNGGGNGGALGGAMRHNGSGAAGSGPGRPNGGGFKEPDIRLPDEHRAAEMGLHEETRKQNEVIDQIHQGLEALLDGAKAMNGELATQNAELEGLDAKASATRDRVGDVNKNSQLRNLGRGKPKPSKEGDMLDVLPTKTGMAAAAAKRLAGI
ncbi:SNAP34 protein [Gonium pectorale]|uniref:SNAP34 protein n=1 Tax=Gonium pectorale TaxID=33097 RepID=A0A150G4J6_GONPE|nr:SNAP34 protein [Gonium pectorale]|eukprot:KXZ44782.1 SNAP34 protein [Gonium pectorale]